MPSTIYRSEIPLPVLVSTELQRLSQRAACGLSDFLSIVCDRKRLAACPARSGLSEITHDNGASLASLELPLGCRRCLHRGAADFARVLDCTVVGYAHWMPGEPANVLGNEDFATANWEVLDDVFTDRWVSPADVPEPATLSLLLTGAAAAIQERPRRSPGAACRPVLGPTSGRARVPYRPVRRLGRGAHSAALLAHRAALLWSG